jgi:phosphoribosyl 1,2-cyclic phosphodiesterase
VTDLGHAPQNVRERIRESDVVVIEANHCPRMLEADPRRSWTLKRRIGGRHGHLSNERMSELLASVASPRWRKVFLAHLSRDCNSREAVEGALKEVRSAVSCDFSIVGHGEGTPFYELG